MNVDRSTHPSSIAIEFHRSTLIDRDRDRSRRARARGCMIDDARRVSTRETPTRGVDGNRASSVARGGRSVARSSTRRAPRPIASRRGGAAVELGRVRSSSVRLNDEEDADEARARGSERARVPRKEGKRLNGGEAGTRAMSASVGRPGGVMALEDGWGFMQVRRETRATRAVSFLRFGTRSGTDWRVVRAR